MDLGYIKNLRHFYLNQHKATEESVFSVILNSYDIDGDLNFEEGIEYFYINPKGWNRKNRIKKTIQHLSGATITSYHYERESNITDEQMLNILKTSFDISVAFEKFVNEQKNKGFIL